MGMANDVLPQLLFSLSSASPLVSVFDVEPCKAQPVRQCACVRGTGCD